MEIPRIGTTMQSFVHTNEQLTASVKNMEAEIIERLSNLQLMVPTTHAGNPVNIGSLQQSDLMIKSEDVESTGNNEIHVHTIVEARSTQFTPCSCNCHTPFAIKTPQWLGSTIGTLQIKYTSTASQSCKACNRRSCQTRDGTVLKTQFYFPPWLLHRMMSMQCSWGPLSGHTVSLRAPRSISSKSNVFMLAQHGNIQGMKRLFERKLASPFDISLEEGRSALHVSQMYMKISF